MGEQKKGWSPIPLFSHREPPFCAAAEFLARTAFFGAALLSVAKEFLLYHSAWCLLSVEFKQEDSGSIIRPPKSQVNSPFG
jgi:hypothetical protein